jgi:hypothetical protein
MGGVNPLKSVIFVTLFQLPETAGCGCRMIRGSDGFACRAEIR